MYYMFIHWSLCSSLCHIKLMDFYAQPESAHTYTYTCTSLSMNTSFFEGAFYKLIAFCRSYHSRLLSGISSRSITIPYSLQCMLCIVRIIMSKLNWLHEIDKFWHKCYGTIGNMVIWWAHSLEEVGGEGRYCVETDHTSKPTQKKEIEFQASV